MTGFKNFILRGNLVELAVAFVMAIAFSAVVQATVDVLLGIVGKIGGEPNFNYWTPWDLLIGAWLTALVTFVIMAAVVYFFIVLPVNTLLLRLRGPAPSSTKPCPQCLGDIPLAATRCKFCAQPIEALPSGRV